MRRVGAVVAALLASAPIASGHDDAGFSSEQEKTLRTYVDRLGKILASGGFTAEKAEAFDFKGFDAHELDHVPEALPELGGDAREALEHLCRTTLHRRGPLGKLENARDICFLLGSARSDDWWKAFRLLRREPLTEGLDRAVVALGRDGRPEVRLIGARLAVSAVLFGRDSEALVSTVLACLSDANPDVAAAVLQVAPNTRDKRVVDRMVACLKDDRALDPRAPPPLRVVGWKRVSDVLAYRLSSMSFEERKGRWKRPWSLDRTGEPVYVALGPDEIRAWWKENRESFGFSTPAPQWRCVLDTVLVLDAGKPVTIQAAGGIPLTVDLKTYREAWDNGTPVTTAEAEVGSIEEGEGEYVATMGSPDAGDDSVSWMCSTWSRGATIGWITCQAAFLPTEKPGRVRMKLIVHIGHEQGG